MTSGDNPTELGLADFFNAAHQPQNWALELRLKGAFFDKFPKTVRARTWTHAHGRKLPTSCTPLRALSTSTSGVAMSFVSREWVSV